jgi:hypothetical protein
MPSTLAPGRSPRQQLRWERDQNILAARALGKSLPQIAAELGLTVEGVRQRILRHGGPSTAQVRGLVSVRVQLAEQTRCSVLDAWVRENPGCTVEQIAVATSYTVRDVRRLLPSLTSRALIARAGRGRRLHTDDELLAGLRDVARYAGHLTLPAYRRHRAELSLATEATIVKRFGSWAVAVERAGFRPTARRGGPQRSWTERDLLDLIRRYVDEPESTGEFDDFRRWLGRHPNAPSPALVMLRLGSWTAAKRALAGTGP